jgi:hypothetical protein
MTGWRDPKDPLSVPKAVRLRDRAGSIKAKADALLREADALLAEAEAIEAAAEAKAPLREQPPGPPKGLVHNFRLRAERAFGTLNWYLGSPRSALNQRALPALSGF